MAKVLFLNGSPHLHGCTATALDEMIKAIAAAREEGGYPEVEHDMYTSFSDGK